MVLIVKRSASEDHTRKYLSIPNSPNMVDGYIAERLIAIDLRLSDQTTVMTIFKQMTNHKPRVS